MMGKTVLSFTFEKPHFTEDFFINSSEKIFSLLPKNSGSHYAKFKLKFNNFKLKTATSLLNKAMAMNLQGSQLLTDVERSLNSIQHRLSIKAMDNRFIGQINDQLGVSPIDAGLTRWIVTDRKKIYESGGLHFVKSIVEIQIGHNIQIINN